MRRIHSRLLATRLGLLLTLVASLASDASALSSYAANAVEVVGSTGSGAVALGVPDGRFVNDSGLGLAGNTDVFDVGEAVDFTFPAALRDVAGEADLIVSAYVGGAGETDNATVQVEVSTDGSLFTIAGPSTRRKRAAVPRMPSRTTSRA